MRTGPQLKRLAAIAAAGIVLALVLIALILLVASGNTTQTGTVSRGPAAAQK